jgi:alpha-ketoglutarate-dependent taurine dioxygenase
METISELFSLDLSLTQLLLTRPVARALPYSAWSDDGRPFEGNAVSDLCAHLATALQETGFAIVRFAHAAADSQHAIAVAAWNLFTSLAEPMPHSAAGELVYEVTVADSTPPPHRYYSQSNIGGDIHTDGTYIHADPPKYVALVCLHPAHLGGDSVLVDGHQVYATLKAGSRSALAWLQREYHFDCDGQGPAATLRRSIFERANGSVRVQYLRSYIESGQRRAREPLAPEALASLDMLDGLLAHPTLRQIRTLQSGDMLLLNNHFMLHGRTAFVDYPERARRRRLIRLWGRPRSLHG